ncbi:MAG: UDP-3-O-acyl-N-acetylglucosamine deacetylase [Candidatus Firestonebacteria bacterium]
MNYQRTIKHPIELSGVGLHTGNKVKVILKPVNANTGIIFIRTDLPSCPKIKAHISNVLDVSYAITLGCKKFKIHTVEHFLGAFYALGIDNIIIEINNNELPIMDGSAIDLVKMLSKNNIQKLNVPKKFLKLKVAQYVQQNDRYLLAVPSDELKISYTVDYKNKLIGTQYIDININDDTFIKDISSARTFGWMDEIKKQRKLGLIKGGSFETALVFGKSKVLNKNGLRFSDEPVRHKVLDILGAIALLGSPIKCHIIAVKSGHSLDIELVKLLSKLL